MSSALKFVAPMLVFSLLLTLAACQPVTEPTPTPSAEEVVQQIAADLSLVGSSWQVESFGGPEPENTLPVIPGTRQTLNFGVQRYAGTAGCNWFLGVYGVEGESLRFRTPAITRTVCDQPAGVMQQEASYVSILWNITEYRRDGEKLLGYTVNNQQLITFVPAEPIAFEGTVWELRFIDNGRQLVPVLLDHPITAQFDGQQVAGSAGCNNYTAGYTLTDTAFAASAIATTSMMCEEPRGLMEQEQLYLTHLETATQLVKTGGLVQLLNEEGVTVLAFGPQ